MKTLDAIKKLNAVKKEDGELLLAEPIDLKSLKGAKEQDLVEAFMTACESLSDEDVDKYLPDDLADIYNAFQAAEDARKAEAESTKPPAKKTEKTPEKKVDKKPEKSAKKDPVKKEEKKETKISGRSVVAEIIKEGKYTEEKVIANALKKGVPDKIAKMYIKAWRKDDRVPEGKKLHESKEKILSFK